MVDHSNSSSQRKPGQQPQPHHSHFQVPRRHYSYQDIHGPLSAGVVEGGHRPFASFHSTPLHHPLHTSSSLTAPTAAPPPPSASTPSRPSLSVAEILERYHDASKDFLVSVLNAKAKEDERRAEEERYMTERIKLQSKQLDIQLAAERLRGSPPGAAELNCIPVNWTGAEVLSMTEPTS
ncbi:hypothetical protein BGZ54_009218 [Gamsiella multidivaricata]|nr:hypothetical protein BGZ54_009218 [Gamsiella multidivaricata]